MSCRYIRSVSESSLAPPDEAVVVESRSEPPVSTIEYPRYVVASQCPMTQLPAKMNTVDIPKCSMLPIRRFDNADSRTARTTCGNLHRLNRGCANPAGDDKGPGKSGCEATIRAWSTGLSFERLSSLCGLSALTHLQLVHEPMKKPEFPAHPLHYRHFRRTVNKVDPFESVAVKTKTKGQTDPGAHDMNRTLCASEVESSIFRQIAHDINPPGRSKPIAMEARGVGCRIAPGPRDVGYIPCENGMGSRTNNVECEASYIDSANQGPRFFANRVFFLYTEGIDGNHPFITSIECSPLNSGRSPNEIDDSHPRRVNTIDNV